MAAGRAEHGVPAKISWLPQQLGGAAGQGHTHQGLLLPLLQHPDPAAAGPIDQAIGEAPGRIGLGQPQRRAQRGPATIIAVSAVVSAPVRGGAIGALSG